MPTQLLLAAAPLVDEIVAVIDEQRQLTQCLLTGARPVRLRLL